METAERFLIYGDFIKAEPFGSGHINDTFLAHFNQAGLPVKYIIRRINKYVFKQPEIVIQNTVNVIEHITEKLLADKEEEISRRVMTLIKCKDGKFYHLDENGDYWCAVLFFEGAYTIDSLENSRQAYKAAKQFGKFQKYIIDEDVNKYKPSIPNFHNTMMRVEQLKSAIKEDVCGRAKSAKDEIDIALANCGIADKIGALWKSKELPLRVTHNDTKINNVMLDKKTDDGICVIDLDTVMPGSVLYDFGDMIRTSASSADEEEKNFSRVIIKLEYFEAIAKGYLEELRSVLNQAEISNLVYGAELIIYEQAIRFLTDYLMGDPYYRIAYNGQNLDRTRNQLSLLKSFQIQKPEMEKIISSLRK
jgi:thiamine kinase-like enzyme